MFCRSLNIGSAAIRLATWSLWSHVALVRGSDVIEASARGGVRLTDVSELRDRYRESPIIGVAGLDGDSAWNYALSQLGKPYDFPGLLGLTPFRNWSDDSAWHCSELVGACLIRGGVFSGNWKKQNRVTPQDIWQRITYS